MLVIYNHRNVIPTTFKYFSSLQKLKIHTTFFLNNLFSQTKP